MNYNLRKVLLHRFFSSIATILCFPPLCRHWDSFLSSLSFIFVLVFRLYLPFVPAFLFLLIMLLFFSFWCYHNILVTIVIFPRWYVIALQVHVGFGLIRLGRYNIDVVLVIGFHLSSWCWCLLLSLWVTFDWSLLVSFFFLIILCFTCLTNQSLFLKYSLQLVRN